MEMTAQIANMLKAVRSAVPQAELAAIGLIGHQSDFDGAVVLEDAFFTAYTKGANRNQICTVVSFSGVDGEKRAKYSVLVWGFKGLKLSVDKLHGEVVETCGKIEEACADGWSQARLRRLEGRKGEVVGFVMEMVSTEAIKGKEQQ